MKKFTCLFAYLMVFTRLLVWAQSVPNSGAGLANCEPGTPVCAGSGWSPSNHYISSQESMGPSYPWVDGPIPAAPSGLQGPNGSSVFMSLYSADYEVKFVESTMTNLVPGDTYTLKYYIMSSRVTFPHRKSGYGLTGMLTTDGVISGDSQTFTPGVNTNQWIQKTLKFKAVSATQKLRFSNFTQSDQGGVINLDLKGHTWLVNESCTAGTAQVALNKTTLNNTCGSTTVNLMDAGPSSPPPGSDNAVIWFMNPNHMNAPVANPTQVGFAGTYYAFFTDLSSNCYNTDNSIAKVTVNIKPLPNNGQQVTLNKTTLSNVCPSSSVNLDDAFLPGSIPAGTMLRWYTNAIHSGQPISNPTNITSSGSYYAFFESTDGNCFNTNSSTAKVTVTITPFENAAQVPLTKSTLNNICPSATANLWSVFSGQTPCNSSLIWFDNPTHTGSPVLSPNNVGAGNYYAFFVNPTTETYNTNFSTAKVTVTTLNCPTCNAGTAQVVLTGDKIKNACPAATVNLNHMYNGVVPNGATLVFYTTPNHQPGTLETGPQAVNSSAVYYAFFYDPINECFNTNNSNAKVAVTITSCPPTCDAGNEQVPVSSKISNVCPSGFANLNNALSPLSKVVTWFANATHSGQPISNPASVIDGTYYAFYYDSVNDCWNTDNSTSKVTVTITQCETRPECVAGTQQVPLSKTAVSNVCPSSTASLNKLIGGIGPSGTVVKWFTNPQHSGTAVANTAAVEAGSYYAFYYDAAADCYNTSNSTAKVQVTINDCGTCNAGVTQVQLNKTEVISFCPGTAIDLNDYFTGVVPQGTSLVWFDNSGHQGNQLSPTQTPSSFGTSYYAFFYDAVNNCFNTDRSTAMLSISTNFQVLTSGCNDVGNCQFNVPCGGSFNLNSVIAPITPYDPIPNNIMVMFI